MRKFTQICLALFACFMLGVQGVSAATEKVYATFEKPSPAGNAAWDGTTKTFTWSAQNSNQIHNVGLPNGDISMYEKLVIDCTINSGGKFRVIFYKKDETNGNRVNSPNKEVYVSNSGVTEIYIEDVLGSEYEDYAKNCYEISLSGGGYVAGVEGTGSVTVNDLYLETADDEATDGGVRQIHADFANPQPTSSASWDAATKSFGWTVAYGNQLLNIGLPSGDLTNYKKLVVNCELGDGTEKFRILIYEKDNSQAHTLFVENSGVTEFNLKLSVPEDYLQDIDYICLSGSGATGSAIINDVYLETYPDGESFDDVFLTAGMFHNWDGVGADANIVGSIGEANFGKTINNGGVIYGDVNVKANNYADLTGCSKMIVKGTAGVAVRTLWNRPTDTSSDFIQVVKPIGEDGFVIFDFKNDEDFKDCEYLHLNVIKNNGAEGSIEYITFDGDFELVVTDGKNFTPNFKEYNTATYERTFNTAYTYGTICLPFAPDAATCANYTFYKLDQASANTLIFVEEEAPKANTPYLYSLKQDVKAEDAKIFTGGSTVVSEETTKVVAGDWNFIGSFKQTTIDLSAKGSFYAYKPAENNGADKISKATNSMEVKPYRAYFHYTGTGNAATTMRVIVRGAGDLGDGTTAIEEVITPDQIEGATIYDIMGRPVQQMQKGQIYIVNGKKVVY